MQYKISSLPFSLFFCLPNSTFSRSFHVSCFMFLLFWERWKIELWCKWYEEGYFCRRKFLSRFNISHSLHMWRRTFTVSTHYTYTIHTHVQTETELFTSICNFSMGPGISMSLRTRVAQSAEAQKRHCRKILVLDENFDPQHTLFCNAL